MSDQLNVSILNRESYSQASTYTQLGASKPVAPYNAHVQ